MGIVRCRMACGSWPPRECSKGTTSGMHIGRMWTHRRLWTTSRKSSRRRFLTLTVTRGLRMPDRSPSTRSFLRFTPLLGIALLGYLLTIVNFSALAGNAKAIGWGMLIVIALGGLSHLVKTWAWRL